MVAGHLAPSRRAVVRTVFRQHPVHSTFAEAGADGSVHHRGLRPFEQVGVRHAIEETGEGHPEGQRQRIGGRKFQKGGGPHIEQRRAGGRGNGPTSGILCKEAVDIGGGLAGVAGARSFGVVSGRALRQYVGPVGVPMGPQLVVERFGLFQRAVIAGPGHHDCAEAGPGAFERDLEGHADLLGPLEIHHPAQVLLLEELIDVIVAVVLSLVANLFVDAAEARGHGKMLGHRFLALALVQHRHAEVIDAIGPALWQQRGHDRARPLDGFEVGVLGLVLFALVIGHGLVGDPDGAMRPDDAGQFPA